MIITPVQTKARKPPVGRGCTESQQVLCPFLWAFVTDAVEKWTQLALASRRDDDHGERRFFIHYPLTNTTLRSLSRESADQGWFLPYLIFVTPLRRPYARRASGSFRSDRTPGRALPMKYGVHADHARQTSFSSDATPPPG
jgi:hypothetical protein